MKQSRISVVCLFAALLGAPIFAQTTIGEGTCSSATLSGNYAISLAGRAVTFPNSVATGLVEPSRLPSNPTLQTGPVAGDISNLLDAVGTANFDGLSKVTFTMAQDTNISTNTPLSWSGTYSVQSNCMGAVNITTGDSATFNLAITLGGTSFTITGKDTTFAFEGNGNTQATGCAVSTLNGVYAFASSQGFYSLDTTGAGGAGTLSGLLQFDGKGNVSGIASLSANGLTAGVTGTLAGITATGTYTMNSACNYTANITNPLAGALVMNLSVYSANSTTSTGMYASIASNPSQALGLGNAYWIYATPSTPASSADGSLKMAEPQTELAAGKPRTQPQPEAAAQPKAVQPKAVQPKGAAL